MKRALPIVVLLLAWPWPALAEPGCDGLQRREFKAMGTVVRLAVCPDGQDVAPALAEVETEFTRLEKLWSTWVADSDVSRLNRDGATKPVKVTPATLALLQRARLGSQQTDGLFDVTFAPLGEVWRFDTPPAAHQPTRLQAVPSLDAVAALRKRVGWQGLDLDAAAGTARFLRPGMAVHLGGIGKGAAVDRAVALLRARGLRSFAVQAGGDLYLAGRNGPRPWRVGIQHPRQPGALLAEIDLENAAFSTSGDYERFALLGGRRYHHILDPRTGFPATASQSATVLATSATEAEVLTKAVFVLGGKAGVKLAESLQCKAVVVDAAGVVYASRGLKLAPAGGKP